MPEYTQKVTFSRTFHFTAKDAAHANAKLEKLIDEAEFASELTNDGWYAFEDEEPEED